MKGLKINREGHNVLGMRCSWRTSTASAARWLRPRNRIYGGGETELRGFDIRSASPYTFIPVKVQFNLTNPDGTTVPRDPTNPSLGNIQIPLPIYRLASVGGDTQLTANLEYRDPDSINQVTLRLLHRLRADGRSAAGAAATERGRRGRCCRARCMAARRSSMARASAGRRCRFSPLQLTTVPHTNFVPRMSNGAELQVILPIVNAPFRLYYAYNPLRLYETCRSSWRCRQLQHVPQLLPELRRGPVQLPAGAAVLWRVVSAARAEEDVSADGGHDVLKKIVRCRLLVVV